MATRGDLPSALRVFRLPELARLICDWVERHDQTTMLRVCRQLHFCVAPFLWKYICDLDLLMELIPGFEVISSTYHCKSVHLPTNVDLTRFNLYAPHVRHIIIGSELECENLDGFRSISRSVALLPNLSRISYFNCARAGQRFVTWARIFLSPSLHTIINMDQRIMSTSPRMDTWLELDSALELLHAIANSCPNFKILEIYPSNTNSQETTLPPGFVADFSKSIRSFTNLRVLSSNTLVFEPRIFKALGELPLLETLAIYPCSPEEIVNVPIIPEHTFLALRTLRLKMMNLGSMVQLCGLKALVGQLTTLDVFLQPCSSYYARPNVSLAKPMSALATNNSILSNLSVHGESPSPILEIEPSLLQCFQRLPLKRLSLPYYAFSEGTEIQDLVGALPTVEAISFDRDSSITLKLLRPFAYFIKLPNLRTLEIAIKFESVRSLHEGDFKVLQDQSQSHVQLKSCFEEIEEDERLAPPVARYLHALWPNITCSLGTRSGYLNDSSRGMQLVNTELHALRQKASLV